MRTLYILKDAHNREGLICNNSEEITEIRAKFHVTNNYKCHYLQEEFEHCKSIDGQNLEDYFLKNSTIYASDPFATHYTIEKIEKMPGSYHPRIFRPILQQGRYSVGFGNSFEHIETYDYFPHDRRTQVQSVQQLNTLNNRLISIFNNIYPTKDNFNAFGHEIRNVLILACTEVEAQLKGILVTNDYDFKKSKGSTIDYVKLLKVLRLDEYELNLSHFPDIFDICPFKGWAENNPTRSLFWYDNYNKVKHDREDEFERANLISAINAVCAIAILLYAQYGDNIPNWKELIGTFFIKQKEPEWNFLDKYFPPFANETWLETKLKI